MTRTLVLVGTGLVGGSFARAARNAGLFDRIVGLDRDPDAACEAVRLGVTDEAAAEIPGDADAVCIGVPVGAIAGWVERAHAGVPASAPIFDVGSVKAPILEALPRPLPNFVPCHPIAGSERQGVSAATGSLFAGHGVVLTPVAETDPAAVAAVTAWWRAVGARPWVEDAGTHDDLLAVTSHVPHLVAFALMRLARDAGALGHAGGGFRDLTRIAAADPEVWTHILRSNAAPVSRRLRELAGHIERLGEAARDDPDGLRAAIEEAGEARRGME